MYYIQVTQCSLNPLILWDKHPHARMSVSACIVYLQCDFVPANKKVWFICVALGFFSIPTKGICLRLVLRLLPVLLFILIRWQFPSCIILTESVQKIRPKRSVNSNGNVSAEPKHIMQFKYSWSSRLYWVSVALEANKNGQKDQKNESLFIYSRTINVFIKIYGNATRTH